MSAEKSPPLLPALLWLLVLVGVGLQAWTLMSARGTRLVIAVVAREELRGADQVAADALMLSLVRVDPAQQWYTEPAVAAGRFVRRGTTVRTGEPLYAAQLEERPLASLPVQPGLVVAVIVGDTNASVAAADFMVDDVVDIYTGAPAAANAPPAAPVLAAARATVVAVTRVDASRRRVYVRLDAGDDSKPAAAIASAAKVLLVKR